MDKRIPMTSLREGYVRHRQEIETAIKRVLDSGWYILGAEVAAFEEKFARWCGAHHCIGVGNGTDAIVIALRALGVGPGDAVFTVSHTAVATVAAIELVGARPIFVDIEPDTLTLDPNHLEDALQAHRASGDPSRPKAVIGVHLYGGAFDTRAVKAICDRWGLRLIEDCAQAHGTTVDGRSVGTFGDIATFSFYPTKNLGAFGDGGAVITNDKALGEAARAIRQYGWRERYVSDTVGLNSRLDELHAAILSVKLDFLTEEVAARRRNASRYDRGLANVVSTPVVRADTTHAYHLYVIRSQNRDRLQRALSERGIETGVHYPVPVHLQPAYADRLKADRTKLAQTERAAQEVLSLPMHAFLADDEVQSVIDAVKESLARH